MSYCNQNVVFEGLGTVTFVAPHAGRYSFDGKITIPNIPAGTGQSSLLVVINKNGSPVYTGNVGARGFFAKVLCAALDSVTIVFSSSDPDDQPDNVIKSTISISECA